MAVVFCLVATILDRWQVAVVAKAVEAIAVVAKVIVIATSHSCGVRSSKSLAWAYGSKSCGRNNYADWWSLGGSNLGQEFLAGISSTSKSRGKLEVPG